MSQNHNVICDVSTHHYSISPPVGKSKIHYTREVDVAMEMEITAKSLSTYTTYTNIVIHTYFYSSTHNIFVVQWLTHQYVVQMYTVTFNYILI